MGTQTKLKTVEVEVTESLSCDNCGANIELEFSDPPGITLQGRDALIVTFGGGYGMFIDPIGEPPEQFKMLWCSACANLLADAFPTIAKRIR